MVRGILIHAADHGQRRRHLCPVTDSGPIDRVIAAQAVQNNLALFSTDPQLDAFGVRRLKKPRR